ncbi:MAG: hypothetical protein ACLU7D_11355 [Collinsella sp.]
MDDDKTVVALINTKSDLPAGADEGAAEGDAKDVTTERLAAMDASFAVRAGGGLASGRVAR